MLCVTRNQKTSKLYPVPFFVIFILLTLLVIVTPSSAETAQLTIQYESLGTGEWPMAGANPQRTSWTPTEVRGKLRPEWYKPFEAYIPQKVQIIAANNSLYVSTSRGLYALDATTGAERWVFPTEMPLGHSPTVWNGVVYVGGLDHKLYAIHADTGQQLWAYEAEAGFETNPLVVEGKVYAGNRDGYMYAIHAEGTNTGQLAWRYQTGGPILYSAAYLSPNIYFASNSSYAYALNAQTGTLVWRSEKLPGSGFRSWWPVIWQDKVIFSGGNNYGTTINWPNSSTMPAMELADVYEANNIPQNQFIGPIGNAPGPWAPGTPTINVSLIFDYFEARPWRRTVFVLNQSNGGEDVTAPVLWTGTSPSSRYPPVVGVDGVLYQQNNYRSNSTIARGHISGWVPGYPHISVVSSDMAAVDEPHAAAAGGNVIYWNLCCDRQSGTFDITIPNSEFPNGQGGPDREWFHISYNLSELIPGYNFMYFNPHSTFTKPQASFGGLQGSRNGVYSVHADVNPPIPYNGKLYMHRSNVLIAFGNTTAAPIQLPLGAIHAAPPVDVTQPPTAVLAARLETEIQKILDAGHLRPAYMGHGLFDTPAKSACGDNLGSYWHNSADTLYTLALSLPYLSPEMQQSVMTYMTNEYTQYPPYQYDHVGWNSGAAREAFIMPPEIANDLVNHPPSPENYTFNNTGGWNGEGVWGRNPFAFYALWKYAEVFGNAAQVWSASQGAFWTEFNDQPSDTLLLRMPLVHNAYIAGYIGYLQLESLAGQPQSGNVNNELTRLMQLRANQFTKDTAYVTLDDVYCRTLNVSSNFMYMVPELADYLRTHALNQVTAAINEYDTLAPYWFVSLFGGGYAESGVASLHDSHALFMARNLILQQPGTDLYQYLDIPAFERGDLYYIQKLIAVLGDPIPTFYLSITPSARSIDNGGTAEFTIETESAWGFGDSVTLAVSDPDPEISAVLSNVVIPASGQAALTLTDITPGSPAIPTVYRLEITATSGDIVRTQEVILLIDALESHLPVMMKR